MTGAPDTTLQLGDVTFATLEVPERIAMQFEQVLVVHKLPGGARIVDAMGADPQPLSWSGRFQGSEATPRAKYLKDMTDKGAQLTLTWAEFSFSVVIKEFHADYERFYQIPYSLTCEVVADNTAPQTSQAIVTTIDLLLPVTAMSVGGASSLDQAMMLDMQTMLVLAEDLADSVLIGLINAVQTLLNDVFDLYNAALTVKYNLLSLLGVVGAVIATDIGASEEVSAAADSVGGVDPQVYPQGPALLVQAAAADTTCKLYEMQSVNTRMVRNVQLAGATGSTVTVGGGTLQDLAVEHFGDANEWTAIAKANGMTDPQIQGVQQLIIPARASGSKGVLRRA